MTLINTTALHQSIASAMQEPVSMTAKEWMEKNNRRGCICCMCYKELKTVKYLLSEKLPVCPKCRSRLLPA